MGATEANDLATAPVESATADRVSVNGGLGPDAVTARREMEAGLLRSVFWLISAAAALLVVRDRIAGCSSSRCWEIC